MRVDWKEEICGHPAIRVRNMLRHVSRNKFSWHYVAEDLRIAEQQAQEIIDNLVHRGWIERTPEQGSGIWHGPEGAEFYRLTIAGNGFSIARAIRRIGRAKADELVKGFLNRIKLVNADDDYGYYVSEAHLFGSYLDPKAADHGDIDIAIDVALRPIIGRDIVEYSQDRANWYGNSVRGFFQRIEFAELEVRRFLKSRSPYISMHPLSDLKATNATAKLLYRAPKKDAVARKPRPRRDTVGQSTTESHMEDQHERIAKAMGYEGDDFERYVHSNRHHGFVGDFTFEIAFELLGERIVRKARVVYENSPDWTYFDLTKNELFTGWGSSSYHIDIFGRSVYSDEDKKSKPRWVNAEVIVSDAVLTERLSNSIFDRIDEECREIDAKRRRKAKLPAAKT